MIFFGCSPHLFAWYCIDKVRRNFLLVTNRVSGLKNTLSTTYLSIPFSLQFKISLRLLRTSSWANNCYKCQDSTNCTTHHHPNFLVLIPILLFHLHQQSQWQFHLQIPTNKEHARNTVKAMFRKQVKSFQSSNSFSSRRVFMLRN